MVLAAVSVPACWLFAIWTTVFNFLPLIGGLIPLVVSTPLPISWCWCWCSCSCWCPCPCSCSPTWR